MARRAKPTPPTGLGEEAQPELTGVPQATTRRLIKIGPDGRVLIPAELRKAMRLRESDTLVAVLDPDGELRLWGTDVGVEKLRQLVAPHAPPSGIVDAFLAERRGLWESDEK